jgi:transcriptional regulator with XRE-family HTH domain
MTERDDQPRRGRGRPKGPPRPPEPSPPARPRGRPAGSVTIRGSGALAAARRAMGITLAELARRSGVAMSILSQLEAGAVVRPSPELVGRLAAGYGLPRSRVRSAIAGAPSDPIAAIEWLRGRAKWHREQADDLERIAVELESEPEEGLPAERQHIATNPSLEESDQHP